MVTGAGPCLAIILAKLGSLPTDIMLLTRRCRRPKKWLAKARAARKCSRQQANRDRTPVIQPVWPTYGGYGPHIT